MFSTETILQHSYSLWESSMYSETLNDEIAFFYFIYKIAPLLAIDDPNAKLKLHKKNYNHTSSGLIKDFYERLLLLIKNLKQIKTKNKSSQMRVIFILGFFKCTVYV